MSASYEPFLCLQKFFVVKVLNDLLTSYMLFLCLSDFLCVQFCIGLLINYALIMLTEGCVVKVFNDLSTGYAIITSEVGFVVEVFNGLSMSSDSHIHKRFCCKQVLMTCQQAIALLCL